MKRRTALIFFGLILAAVLAYAGWCARHFVKRPGISMGNDTPEDARQAISSWHSNQSYFRCEPFTWRRYLHHLQYPWKNEVHPPVFVRLIQEGGNDAVVAGHVSRPECLEFRRIDGCWRLVEKTTAAEIERREESFARRFEAAKKRFLERTPFLPDHGVTDF